MTKGHVFEDAASQNNNASTMYLQPAVTKVLSRRKFE